MSFRPFSSHRIAQTARLPFFAIAILLSANFVHDAHATSVSQVANREPVVEKSTRPLPSNIHQLIVAIAPTWNSIHGKLQLFERDHDGKWIAVSEAVPVLFGKNGLAWGRGLRDFSGFGEAGLHKREGDKRAPAGIFKIGKIYTYDKRLPRGADFPFHTVGAWDAWVSNVHSPLYNRFVTVDPKNPPPWFHKEKMRHGDFAYRWLVEIRANSNPPVPGCGSAIFFHIRRGANRPTAGCTSMPKSALIALIKKLRAAKNPCYVLLPWNEYRAKWRAWNLPDLKTVRAIVPAR